MNSPNKSRSGGTRRPIERIMKIHEAVRRGRYPNCKTLAKKIEVTQKTVQRDINFMRDDLDLPIEYDRVRHGYYYTKSVGDFPLVDVSAEDAVALFLARRALSPLQNSPLEATLRQSFKRLSQSLRGRISFCWSDLDQAFSVSEFGIAKADVAVFEKLSRAVIQSMEVSFDYRSLRASTEERRKVRPYSMTDVGGGWYLIGFDLVRKAIRTFAVQRMKGIRVSQKGFIRPDDFDAESYLGESFGIWRTAGSTGKRHKVRVRLEGWAARVAAERRWHPSQDIKVKVAKGRTDVVEIAFELAGFEEITRWILSWGSLAEVISPKSLRDHVAKEIAGAAKRYR